jgi:carbon-monoxide dehydrogenase medium subunit
LAGAPGAAKVLSGGTDLLVQLRSGRAKPGLIVDIKKIPGISSIREQDGGFVISASTLAQSAAVFAGPRTGLQST